MSLKKLVIKNYKTVLRVWRTGGFKRTSGYKICKKETERYTIYEMDQEK